MKNKAKHRIRYYAITSGAVFSRNSAKNDYLCRELLRENRRSLKCRTVFQERKQGFATSLPIRKRQRISNENLAQLLEILLFSLFATRRESTGNISASQTLNLIPRHNLTLSNFLRIFSFALGTPARQNTSKLVFALAYSYLCREVSVVRNASAGLRPRRSDDIR